MYKKKKTLYDHWQWESTMNRLVKFYTLNRKKIAMKFRHKMSTKTGGNGKVSVDIVFYDSQGAWVDEEFVDYRECHRPTFRHR